jgi:FkbM family methyltransferase
MLFLWTTKMGSVSTIIEPTFPPQCTNRDYDIIRYQLPENDCLNDQGENRCSVSYATRCPDARWWREQYESTSKTADTTNKKNTQRLPPPIAISVGCNKAIDAVHTLRLISGDTRFDSNAWRDTLLAGQSVAPGPCQEGVKNMEDFLQGQTLLRHSDAVVHCIEPMPSTAQRLSETTQKLGWKDHMVVTNIAISDVDGEALFPNVDNVIGVEYLGLGDCQNAETQNNCKKVQVKRLDTFAAERVPKNKYIEFLSIDAEGYDFEALFGATETLKRSKYLEFEYHFTGAWISHPLIDAINMLKRLNYVCYWAGRYGHLWRITDCWLGYYERHTWSNVACVNIGIPSTTNLASRMEQYFQNTLKLDNQIQYVAEFTSPFH